MEYDIKFEYREQEVDGVGHWLWQKNDTGSWDGPHREWSGFIDLWGKHIKKFDVVLQAGGNNGLYPRLFKKYFKHVYTWEPDPINFHCLINNCQDDHIIKTQAALGAEHKFIRMSIARSNSGAARVAEVADGILPMVTIDSYNFKSVDFVQLDVEDYEPFVLQGAKETIKRFHPLVSTENGHHEDVVAVMNELEYFVVGGIHSDTLWKYKFE